MTSSLESGVWFGSAAIAVLLAAAPARAQDSRTCIASHGRMQELMQRSQLLAAREAAIACTAAACPAEIRAECSAFRQKVEAQIPTLVVSVSGAEQGAAGFIEVDGEIARSQLEGDPIRVDPGKHRVRVELDDGRSANASVDVELGKQASVQLALPPADRALPESSSSSSEAAPADAAPESGIPTSAWVAGGIGLAGIAIGSYFGLRAISLKNDADVHCPSEDHCYARGMDLRDDSADAATISTVAFAVGIVGLGTAATLIVLAPAGPQERAGLAIVGSF